jgi:hypothetical protein
MMDPVQSVDDAWLLNGAEFRSPFANTEISSAS